MAVLGYLGEPFVRIDDAGVAINDASPTAASTRLSKNRRPASGIRPAWTLQPHRNFVVWHDQRVQALPPGVSHVTWRIPVILDGRRTNIRGETWRLGRPALWPWLTLLLLFLAGTPIFLHALVLSTFSGLAARLLAITAIGAGLAATALGALLYASDDLKVPNRPVR